MSDPPSLPGSAGSGPRTEFACRHLSVCPGCPRFGQDELPPLAEGLLREFCEAQGVSLEPIVGSALGYRGRARLAVRGRVNSPKIGLFEEGSHRVVDIPDCPIHHPAVNRVAAAVKRAIRRTRVPPYSDYAHAGVLRYLQVVRERSSGRVQVAVVANVEESEKLAAFVDFLCEQLGSELHSLFVNRNTARTNTILGEHWDHLSGPVAAVEVLGGVNVYYPPDAFGQSNLSLFEQIVEQAHEWVLAQGCPEVTELYAGVGAIGLGLLARGCRVRFNELSSGGLRGLELGLAALQAAGDCHGSAEVLPGPAEAFAVGASQSPWVVVDPPRKGLTEPVVRSLGTGGTKNLIYVSCGLPSFLSDAQALIASGFRLRRCQAYALFPYTEHVETLALFGR